MSKAVSGPCDGPVSWITGHEWPLAFALLWKIASSKGKGEYGDFYKLWIHVEESNMVVTRTVWLSIQTQNPGTWTHWPIPMACMRRGWKRCYASFWTFCTLPLWLSVCCLVSPGQSELQGPPLGLWETIRSNIFSLQYSRHQAWESNSGVKRWSVHKTRLIHEYILTLTGYKSNAYTGYLIECVANHVTFGEQNS